METPSVNPQSSLPAVLLDRRGQETHLVQQHPRGPVSPPRPEALGAPAGPGGKQEAGEGLGEGRGWGGWAGRARGTDLESHQDGRNMMGGWFNAQLPPQNLNPPLTHLLVKWETMSVSSPMPPSILQVPGLPVCTE